MAKEEERQVQVNVQDRSVLVLPRGENHLEGAEAERLREGKTTARKDHRAFNDGWSARSSLEIEKRSDETWLVF